MQFKVVSLKRCYKWVCALGIVIILMITCILTKGNMASQAQTESLINQAKEIENIEEEQKQIAENPMLLSVKEPTLAIPKEYDGWDVVGRLSIQKINLVTYILSTTTKESLNKSVTKLCGPRINQVGNFCITGHNYRNSNMFSKLKQLEVGDELILTDKYEVSIHYRIYSIIKVDPSDVKCLEQETGGEREVTLITCTPGALKRLIVKATEIYD